MDANDKTSRRPTKSAINQRSKTGKLAGQELVTPEEASKHLPAKANAEQRPVAEVYRPYTRSAPRTPSAQQYELRRFVHGDAMGWFTLVAHKIDLVIRPTFLLITQFVNFLLRWGWYIAQRTTDSRSLVYRPAPELRPGSAAATLVCVIVVLSLMGGVVGPVVLPAENDPRAFHTHIASSDWLKAINPWQQAADAVKDIVNEVQRQTLATAPIQPPGNRVVGDRDIRGSSSLTAEQVDRVLASYSSPATGTGKAWLELGAKYNIDPAYALAFFIHESSAGTNPKWDGMKPDGSTTHDVGNISCAGYDPDEDGSPNCYGRWRDYDSWETGIEDWYRLIAVEYIEWRGTITVADIIPIYAPSSENNVDAYISSVDGMVDDWRTHGIP